MSCSRECNNVSGFSSSLAASYLFPASCITCNPGSLLMTCPVCASSLLFTYLPLCWPPPQGTVIINLLLGIVINSLEKVGHWLVLWAHCRMHYTWQGCQLQ